MSNKIIYIRDTVDWSSMTMEKFINQENFGSPPSGWTNFMGEDNKNFILQLISHWNKIFNISFFDYRKKLKDISIKNFKSTGASILKKLPNIKNKDEKLVIIPMDDDDWINPKICDLVSKYIKPKRKLIWNMCLGGCWYPTRKSISVSLSKKARATCNSAYMLGHKIEEELFIDEVWTYLPKTPASIMNLKQCKKKEDVKDLFDFYMSSEKTATDETQWAVPYLEELDKFDKTITTNISKKY